MKNFGDPKDMSNRDWVHVLMLKFKHENYPEDQALDLIYKYVWMDFEEKYLKNRIEETRSVEDLKSEAILKLKKDYSESLHKAMFQIGQSDG